MEKTETVVECVHRDMKDGTFWLDVRMNRQPYAQIGPFDTVTERQRVMDDILNMARSFGAKDLPTLPQ